MRISAAPMEAGSSMAAAGGTDPTLAVVANQGTVSTASSRPGAMETGPTTCTGHRADLAATTPVSEAWAAGMAASITSMGLGAAVCLAVIASVEVALVEGGLVEVGSAASAAEVSDDRSTDKREIRKMKSETISNDQKAERVANI